MTGYTDSAALALGVARIEARSVRASEIGPGHLLVALSSIRVEAAGSELVCTPTLQPGGTAR
ncbi:hypothetical protein GCM10023194_35020 [Planotetraspora phitsanulokensis]|uniref:Uncharacterized protein n=1 Tax=Planotetraspora phitsanulokensis TaxID=575192 RepID=A0A8J3U112_9ACTN|nr:hypothetical protein [Planotetraspora phitsanulokensis]GII36369.1 hypothetical protein Pph01_13720 [Planotetraspora phitsanulokensis]